MTTNTILFMSDNILQSDTLLLTNEENYVVSVPNEGSSLDYEEQGLSKCENGAISSSHYFAHGIQYGFIDPLLKNIEDPKFQTFLKKAHAYIKKLPSVFYLPVLFDEKIKELTPAVLTNYENQLISREHVEFYERDFVKIAKNYKQLENLLELLRPYLENPIIGRHIDYQKIKENLYYEYSSTLGEFNTVDELFDCFLGYSNNEEFEYWKELALSNPNFLSQSNFQPLYVGTKTQESLELIYDLPELKAFPQSVVIVAQDPIDKSVCFLQQVKPEKDLYLTTELGQNLGVFFELDLAKSFFLTSNAVNFPPNTFFAEYKDGKLKTFHTYNSYESDNYLSVADIKKLNIVLETVHLEKSLSSSNNIAHQEKTVAKRMKI